MTAFAAGFILPSNKPGKYRGNIRLKMTYCAPPTYNNPKEVNTNNRSFKWQKNKKANLTGTLDSYHPVSHSDKEKMSFDKKNKNSVWKPD